MALIEVLIIIFAVALLLTVVYPFLKPKVERHYKPPVTGPGEPKQHFRTSSLSTFWFEHNCPSEIGAQIVVNMQSGKQAVYELRNIQRAPNVDWNWYDFEFIRYTSPTIGKEDRPRDESLD